MYSNKLFSKLSILIVLIITVFLAFQIPNLEFDYELENFFPLDDPDLAFYQGFSEKFGQDNDFLLLGIESEHGIFNSDFLNKIDTLTNSLSSLASTKSVFSISNLKNIRKTPLGYIDIPLIHKNESQKLIRDSINFYKEPVYRNSFLSKTGNSIKVILLHEKFFSEKDAKVYIIKIESIIKSIGFDSTYIAGKAKAQNIFIETVKSEFSRFLLFSLFLIILMLLIYMKKPLLILITLLIAGFTLIASLGLMSILGKKIDLLTSLIPTILMVVSMSNIVHLFSKIREENIKLDDTSTATKKAVKEVGFATLLTTLTTAFGFLTLVSIRVKPIFELGIYTAIGILIAFAFTYFIFPQIIILTKPKFSTKKINLRTDVFLRNTFHLVLRKQKRIFLSFFVFTIIVITGITFININSSLIDDLPQQDDIVKDFAFFTEEFEGAKPWSMSIVLKDTSKTIYQKEVIIEIEKIEVLAKKIIGTDGIFSPVSYVKSANRILHQGKVNFYQLPDNQKDWNASLKFINKFKPERKLMKVTHQNEAQLTGYNKEIGSKKLLERTKIFLNQVDKDINHNLLSYQITGTSHLIDKSHEMLSINLVKGIVLAVLLVAIISGFLFRSFKMVLITIIPNLIPIMATAAIMGYFGIDLNLGTSIIFAISFGIVVDDSIHFLSKFRIEKKKGLNHLYALKRTIISTGSPIIFTTIILTSGFLIFTISNFSATFYTGLFVSVSFTVALIADLLLLPVLILWFYDD